VAAQVREFVRIRRDDTPLSEFTRRDSATVGGKFTGRCTWLLWPWNSASPASKTVHTSRMISSSRSRWCPENTGVPAFRDEDQMRVQDENQYENIVFSSAYVTVSGHEAN
jgi:hypothetical protein